MPEASLPLLPEGTSQLTSYISILREDTCWAYFFGMTPVFVHPGNDLSTFRMYTSQLYCEGHCKQTDITRVFGVSASSVKRSAKLYREGGAKAFFQEQKVRGSSVIKGKMKDDIQALLDDGLGERQISKETGVHQSTIEKAVQSGRLHKPSKSEIVTSLSEGSTKSERSIKDEEASTEMGTACTRQVERCMASVGILPEGAETRFEESLDVKYGGLLCALPALAANGLFIHLEKYFSLPKGFYTVQHIILLVAYMALARIKTVEKLRHEAPGELGKVMGLDRIPEVRCLRIKLSALSDDHQPEKWASELSKDWMKDSPELAGTLYIDGHVSVYHGSSAKIPKKYVSRQKLCLRGNSGYWVNDALGNPFFVVDRVVDDGMINVLKEDIVPRLLKDVPNQPNDKQLESNSVLNRFTLVFDREGYSPVFFKEMWDKHRISCLTYRKCVKDTWPEDWFQSVDVPMPNGEIVRMKLAEMGTFLGDKKNGLWLREVRKLKDSGHQTSFISSEYGSHSMADAGKMFSRWSQENFFRYMRQHYNIDGLVENSLEDLSGPIRVVNPKWRALDSQYRSINGKLSRSRATFAEMTMHPEDNPKKEVKFLQRQAELVETIEILEEEKLNIALQRKETSKHIDFEQLAEEDKFQRLAPGKKQLIDTVKMIAYRAETAMSIILRPIMAKPNEARALIRELLNSDADLCPNIEKGELHVRIHPMTSPQGNRTIQELLKHLNEAEFVYPGTKLKLRYSLGNGDKFETRPGAEKS
jgi:transposase